MILRSTFILSALLVACGGDDEPSPAGSGGAAGTGGSSAAAGTSGTAGSAPDGGGSGGTGGSVLPPACASIVQLAEEYKAAHPGNNGKDWDILAKSPAEIASDPAAQQLLALCQPDQLPVIPLLAWEYGGGDHPWINPQASASVYCVYTPVNPSTEHWAYDAVQDHVTADVYVKCPAQNPCKDEQGANQVLSCLGDPTNIEILVDTASFHDGADVGLALSEASTELKLILPEGTKVHLYTGL